MLLRDCHPHARFLSLSMVCAVAMVAGCADPERDEFPESGSGAFDDGGDGSGGSTPQGSSDGGDDGGGSDSGDAGDQTDGGASDDGGDGADDGGSAGAPDCTKVWVGQYIPSNMYMSMDPPETAEEMFCHVNMERINYSFHTRNNGCVWDGTSGAQLTWPYEMQWDAALAASAQAEAEAVAAGGQPKGQAGSGGVNFHFFVDGCGTSEYTVTSADDEYDNWPRVEPSYWPDTPAPLTKANGSARMGIFYYDPGPDSPTLTKLGVGLGMNGDKRNWVIKFGQ